jgi:hypothetical protein
MFPQQVVRIHLLPPVGGQPRQHRELERYLRPSAGLALERDLAAVALDDLARGGQA